MPALALRDIEKTAKTLFLNRYAREKFLLSKPVAAENDICPDVLPHLDKEGVSLYADLLDYGFHEVVDSVYPGCAKLIDNDWYSVVENYLLAYPPSHYNLNQLAKSFPAYLKESGKPYTKKFPFLVELADYEWLELEVMESPVEIKKFHQGDLVNPGQFEKYAPIINGSLVIRNYHYPVPKIVEYIERNEHSFLSKITKKDTIVAVFRDTDTLDSRFVELENISAAVVNRACQEIISYKELMLYAISMRQDVDPQQTVFDFLTLAEKLQLCNLFVGSVLV